MSIPESSTNNFLSGFLHGDEDEVEVSSRPKVNALDADLYTDTDYEGANAAGAVISSESKFQEIDRLIEANARELIKRYPSGGIKASRVVTSTILRQAPVDYFDRYQRTIKDGTDFVQNALADRGGSDLVGESQAHPTDSDLQEKAYILIKALILEYLGGSTRWQSNEGRASSTDRAVIAQLISNEIIGFSVIDPLWRDRNINEIVADGPFSVKIEVAGSWQHVRSCKFRDQAQLEGLLERLFQSVGKSASRVTPRLKARLHDQSRLYSMHKSIMPMGPSLNIRRHPERNWEPKDLIDRGSASEELLTDLGNLIRKGCSYLVVGATSTGKTSMLNALSGFYKNNVRILTVEDSLELKLNPNKMLSPGMETIAPSSDGEFKGVTIRELVQSTLQMAPDVVIVGESIGGEAFDLCTVLNTGHAGASTLHANSVKDTIPRLMGMIGQAEVIPADSALPMIGSAFDFIIFLEHSSIDGSRKILEVAEIPNYPDFDQGNKPFLKPRTIWRLDRKTGDWNKLNEISDELVERRGLDLERDLTWEELKELSKV